LAEEPGWLRAVESALDDADAQLATDLGGRQELTSARLWHGDVLVDWQPDPVAGDCLLHASLLRKLLSLGAHVAQKSHLIEISAPGRSVAALSQHHGNLVERLGGARRISLTLRLRFSEGTYVGGEETFSLSSGKRPSPLLRLSADVRVRQSKASPRTSPAQK
jgi:hypothetical protein